MQTIPVRSELLTENLDRYLASQLQVLGQIDLTHPAGAELLEYSIMRDLIGIHLLLSHKKHEILYVTFVPFLAKNFQKDLPTASLLRRLGRAKGSKSRRWAK